MPLVHQFLLASLQFSAQPPQLPLIFAQESPLVDVLIHGGSIANVLGSVGKLQSAQGFCSQR